MVKNVGRNSLVLTHTHIPALHLFAIRPNPTNRNDDGVWPVSTIGHGQFFLFTNKFYLIYIDMVHLYHLYGYDLLIICLKALSTYTRIQMFIVPGRYPTITNYFLMRFVPHFSVLNHRSHGWWWWSMANGHFYMIRSATICDVLHVMLVKA